MKACRFALLAIAFALPLTAFADLILPTSVTAEATGPNGAAVSFDARATGNEDDRGRTEITVTCAPASMSTFPLGTTMVNCSGSDGSRGSFPVIVVDTTGPVLKLPPALDFIAPPPPPPPQPHGRFVNYLSSATDLVDGLVPVHCQPPSGGFFPIGPTTVNCGARDSRNNKTTGSFTVTIYLHPPAPGEGPRDLTVEATGPYGARVVYDTSDPDGEGGRPASTDCAPAPGAMFPLGNTEVTCAIGGRFWIVVKDTTPPSIALNGSLSAVTANPNGAILTFSAIGSDLVDGTVAANCSPGSGDLFAPGPTTITCNASDSHGNSVAQTFTAEVLLLNSEPPVITVPADITAEATGGSGAAVTYSATAYDDTDGAVPVNCSHASGSVFAIGTTTVTCTATDSNANTGQATFLITVSDTTPPELTIPPNLSAEATGPNGAQVTFSVSAVDIVDGPLAVECTHASGLFPIGTTAVTCSATDARGNGTPGSFTVSVVDTTPPSLTVPADITVEATGPNGAQVTFSVSAEDIVDGPVAVQCTHSSGLFPLGTTAVACSATDAHGNSTPASFNVNVVDTTPPTVTAPADMTVEATSPAGAAATFSASATDIVDGTVSTSCTPASGSTFVLGSTTVICSATDAHGNTGSDSFQVHVVDTTPPDILSLIASPNQLWSPNKRMADVTVSAIVSDIADPAPLVRIYDVTCNEPITSGDSAITGLLTASLRVDRLGGGGGRVYTLHIEAIDASGNRSTATVDVTVPHDQRRR